MAIIARQFTVMLAYILACMAASIVLTVGALSPQWDQMAPHGLPAGLLWSVVGIGTAIIAVVAVLPSFLVIALAEGFGWRSIVFYGVLGGILALALTYGIDFARYAYRPCGLLAHESELLAASGIAGGLVYWVFAGRKAGCWK